MDRTAATLNEEYLRGIRHLVRRLSTEKNSAKYIRKLETSLPRQIGGRSIVLLCTTHNPAYKEELLNQAKGYLKKIKNLYPSKSIDRLYTESLLSQVILGVKQDTFQVFEDTVGLHGNLTSRDKDALSSLIELTLHSDTSIRLYVQTEEILYTIIEALFRSGRHRGVEYIMHHPTFSIDSSRDTEGLFMEMLQHYCELIIYDSVSESKKGFSKLIFALLKCVDYQNYQTSLRTSLKNIREQVFSQQVQADELLSMMQFNYARLCYHRHFGKADILREVFKLSDSDTSLSSKLSSNKLSLIDALKYVQKHEAASKIGYYTIGVLLEKASSATELIHLLDDHLKLDFNILPSLSLHLFKKLRTPEAFAFLLERLDFIKVRKNWERLLNAKYNGDKNYVLPSEKDYFEQLLFQLDNTFSQRILPRCSEESKVELAFNILQKYLAINRIPPRTLKHGMFDLAATEEQRYYYRAVLDSDIDSELKEAVLNFHIGTLPFDEGVEKKKKFPLAISNERIYESLINKAGEIDGQKGSQKSMSVFRAAKKDGIQLNLKSLYKLINIVDNFNDSMKVYSYLAKYYPRNLDARVFAQLLLAVNADYYSVNLPVLYREIQKTGVDFSEVLKIAISKTDVYTKIRRFLALNHQFTGQYVQGHYLAAVRSCPSYRNASAIFWSYLNNKGEISEVFVVNLIRKTKNWGQIINIIDYLNKNQVFYFNDRFIYELSLKAVSFKDIKLLQEKFPSGNTFHKQHLIVIEMANKNFFYNRAKMLIHNKFLDYTQYKREALTVLLDRATDNYLKLKKKEQQQEALSNVLTVVKQFEQYGVVPNLQVLNQLVGSGLYFEKRFTEAVSAAFLGLLYEVSYDQYTYALFLRNHKKYGRKVKEIMQECLDAFSEELLDHRVVLEYFNIYRSNLLQAELLPDILSRELDLKGYYLFQDFFRKGIPENFFHGRQAVHKYWRKTIDEYQENYVVKKGKFITLQLVKFEYSKKGGHYLFFVYGSKQVVRVSPRVIKGSFFQLKPGDFTVAKVTSVKPSLKVNFNDVPYRNLKNLFQANDFPNLTQEEE